jgi:hypothetical protein
MNTHQCSRAEKLKKIKCYKCQKRGHFAKDCNEDVEDEDDDSDEEISDEEIQKPQAKGKSKKITWHTFPTMRTQAKTMRILRSIVPIKQCIVHGPVLIHLLHLSRSRILYRSAATK